MGLIGLLLLAAPRPAGAVAKEIIELQRDVALLQQQVRDLQQTVDRNHAVLRTLVEQALDAASRMSQTAGGLEQSVQEAQAHSSTRVDSLTTEVQALRDSLEELSARLGRVSQQLAENQSVLQSVDARLAPAGPTPAAAGAETARTPGPATTLPPAADVLYSTALRDFTSGKYDLARQQFIDYLTYYGRTELAGNAQFYVGETFYHQKDYRRAIAEYDKVFESYPASYKIAAAHLKKGYSLLELNQREAGTQALKSLVEKYPRSEEARLARSRLERLGIPLSR
jgi:tol-pal system protein YbgF